MIPSEHTIKELRDLCVYMLEEPRRVNMDYWAAAFNPKKYNTLDEDCWDIESAFLHQKPSCGAIGCMAGGLCIMKGKIKPSQHFASEEIYTFSGTDTCEMAAEILQLTEKEAGKLFYHSTSLCSNGWSEENSHRLKLCEPGTKEYVQVIVSVIEQYIATGTT